MDRTSFTSRERLLKFATADMMTLTSRGLSAPADAKDENKVFAVTFGDPSRKENSPMTQQQTEPVQIYETATTQARVIIAGAKPDQMKNPTPCAEWDVAGLLDHTVKAQAGIAGTVSGGQVAQSGTPLERFDAAVSTMLTAVRSPGGLDKKVQGRQGEVPAVQMLSGACMDLAVHTWDLAKATGQDTELDPGVVEFISPIVEGIAKRGPSQVFSAPVDIPSSASRQDKLMALTGRQP